MFSPVLSCQSYCWPQFVVPKLVRTIVHCWASVCHNEPTWGGISRIPLTCVNQISLFVGLRIAAWQHPLMCHGQKQISRLHAASTRHSFSNGLWLGRRRRHGNSIMPAFGKCICRLITVSARKTR